uniref:Transmembrane protein n=1 Tax=Haemonchus contortus TaxID=6289 RepID=A0A7I4Y2W3_HAECO
MPSIAIDEDPSEKHVGITSNKQEPKEVIEQSEECPKRAYAGSDNGCCDNEKFLISMAIALLVMAVFTLIDYYHMALLPLVCTIAVAVLLIVGVCTKSSICMLISVILLIILAVIRIASLVIVVIEFIKGEKQLDARAIISIILNVLVCICIIFAIISACKLRSEY